MVAPVLSHFTKNTRSRVVFAVVFPCVFTLVYFILINFSMSHSQSLFVEHKWHFYRVYQIFEFMGGSLLTWVVYNIFKVLYPILIYVSLYTAYLLISILCKLVPHWRDTSDQYVHLGLAYLPYWTGAIFVCICIFVVKKFLSSRP